jgi:hypothetical protein
MNKAFIREPDRTADYCPRCGSQGEPVGADTIRSHLPEAEKIPLSDPANFCPSPRCEVAYFDGFEQIILARDLRAPVYPKNSTAPICACFGLTVEDIEQDVREGVVTRTKAALEKAKSPAARCKQLAANGRPCIAFVQKYYLQCKTRTS